MIDGLSRGAAGLVKFGHPFQGDAQGIAVGEGVLALDIPHHGLFDLGHLGNVLKGFDVTRFHPSLGVQLAVELAVVVGPLDYFLEFLQLQRPQLFLGHGFQNGVPIFVGSFYHLLPPVYLLRRLWPVSQQW